MAYGSSQAGHEDDRGLSKYFSFRGSAGRQQFWAVSVIAVFAGFIIPSLLSAIGAPGGNASGIAALGMLGTLVIGTWAYCATAVRRARDAGISPWWVLLTFVPFLAVIIFLVLGFLRSASREV